MKIIFTGDNHIYYHDQRKNVLDLMESICKENPDVVCNVGDVGEVLMHEDTTLVQELFSAQPTLFVAGNHDLYSQKHLNPIKAMEEWVKVMRWGTPLQTHWTDVKTVYEKDDCLFVGSILFPDFSHEKMIMPIKYYDLGCPTIDATYINLKGGFLQYTRPLLEAFEKKLQLINKSKCKNVIIISHYPCFISQYKLNPTEDISVYFYCHSAGLMIKKVAERNLEKNFYCISGHGHNFNIGQFIQETPNITTHGFVTDYDQQRYITLEFPSVRD